MRVALLQMDIALGDPEENRRKVAEMFPRAAGGGTDVIVLPEMWNTGYSLHNLEDIADREGQPSVSALAALAARHGVNVVGGSIADLREGRAGNICHVINRKGETTASYAKIHLFPPMEEDRYLAAGDRPVTFRLDGTPCGVMICYDLRFPELARTLALQGARVLFVPAQWPYPRLHHWRYLHIARAIENQLFVVACNRVGHSGKAGFFGHSLVVDPGGEVLAEAGEDECILRADLDLSRVEDARQTIPVFADRRPEVYRL